LSSKSINTCRDLSNSSSTGDITTATTSSLTTYKDIQLSNILDDISLSDNTIIPSHFSNVINSFSYLNIRKIIKFQSETYVFYYFLFFIS
jgi:hypothetical protein